MKTITAGDRSVEIHYFGRGHATGELVVFLPKEKVVVVADLLSENGGIQFDSGLDGCEGSNSGSSNDAPGDP